LVLAEKTENLFHVLLTRYGKIGCGKERNSETGRTRERKSMSFGQQRDLNSATIVCNGRELVRLPHFFKRLRESGVLRVARVCDLAGLRLARNTYRESG
jgi:hypothetical protein